MKKKIKFIKFITTHYNPPEDNLIEVKKEFLFNAEQFKNNETIEEIRDQFYIEINSNQVIDYLEIYTYLTKKDLKTDKFQEYLGE